MKHVDTYDKTVNGKNEVTDNAAGLSMMERRVLILVNGENEVEKLAKLSLCDDIDATLDRLLELGLIQVAETTLVEIAPQAAPEKAAAADDVTVTARDLMCNTLQTFGNKVKIAGKPWYQALSETPGGMYQADDLRKEVLELLQREDADAA
jgi:hypothetical protein